jgi:hypothetical protein
LFVLDCFTTFAMTLAGGEGFYHKERVEAMTLAEGEGVCIRGECGED